MRMYTVSSLLLSLLLTTVLSAPLFVRAATSDIIMGVSAGFSLGQLLGANMTGQSGTPNHPACVAETTRRASMKPPKPPPNGDFPCIVPAPNGVGTVTGVCFKYECKGVSYTGVGGTGGGATGLDQVMKTLGDLFGKLMSQPPASSAPPPSSYPSGSTGYGGCTGTYYQTSDVSRISDPCAQYTPTPIVIDPTIDTGSCLPLNEALGLCSSTPNSCPDVPTVQCVAGTHPVSSGYDGNGCVLPDTCAPDGNTGSTPATSTAATTTPPRIIFATTTVIGGLVVPPIGGYGDFILNPTGATIMGGMRDVQNNVEVAGFYGAETTLGQQPQGLIGEWCKTRPWANNFLSKIISPSFFDGLCTWRGYQVGMPAAPAAPTVILQQKPKPSASVTPVSTTSVPYIPPRVDIWASPASVSLGGRTSIFWNTQGVKDCTQTSSSGGFNQNSLSGGAATQPITAATTFTISCLALDGSQVEGSVTVYLKI